MEKAKTVIGYVRVSTENQATDGVSLDAQQARINAWALANGHPVGRVFVDAGLSGSRYDNRPALLEALDAVSKVGGILVVYSLSRLARSTKDTITIGEHLDKAGADLVSLTEKIDTTSAAGKMVFRMLAVMAEFERDLVSERTIGALAHKRSKGERVGTIPFGYQLNADGVHLVEHTGEQQVIATITELRGRGITFRGIAEHLNDNGVTSKSGGTWFASAVRSVIITSGKAAA